MTTQTLEKIVDKLKDFPDDKVTSLMDYMEFLKKKKSKIPNKETIQAFEDTENNVNLTYCKNADEMFQKLGI